MEKRLFVVKSKHDLERCSPVMKERRPHLSCADSLAIYDQSHASDGSKIVAIEDGDTLVLRVKPDNVKLQVARSAVSSLVSAEIKK